MDGPAQASYGSNALLALLGLLTLQQWAIVVGIILSAITCYVNWRYKRWYYSKMLEESRDHHKKLRDIEQGEE